MRCQDCGSVISPAPESARLPENENRGRSTALQKWPELPPCRIELTKKPHSNSRSAKEYGSGRSFGICLPFVHFPHPQTSFLRVVLPPERWTSSLKCS